MIDAINVDEVLEHVPHFDTFCSVEKLHELVDSVRGMPTFSVEVAGTSARGVAIHHVQIGAGRKKALIVGGPHAMEPIGSLTVFSLIALLREGNGQLLDADVEWHVVPCIDPDGAMLNEGWTQRRFTLENFVRNYFVQPRDQQVDFTFPIAHKQLVFDSPSREAAILKRIIDAVQPDLFFSLHNLGLVGGTWCGLTRAIDVEYCRQIQELVKRYGLVLQPKVTTAGRSYGPGIRELPTMKVYYDHLDDLGVSVHKELRGAVGATSLEYLVGIKPGALGMVAELPLIQHPRDASDAETGQHLRQLKLRLDAEDKFLASVILEEWKAVKDDLDQGSPYYRKLMEELVSRKDHLHKGLSAWYAVPMQELLCSPDYARQTTERDLVRAVGVRIYFMANAYGFFRLLETSAPTAAVARAKARMERVFDGAFKDLDRYIDFSGYEVIDYDRLAKVQLGCGLIGLNSILESGRGP